MLTTAEIGRRGEDVAVGYLRSRGYMICAQNWRSGRYEIDIVAERDGVTHFVEVRARRAGSLLSPEATINATKANAIRRAASAYIRECRIAGEVAFDLLAVDVFPDGNYDVRYVPDAVEFGW